MQQKLYPIKLYIKHLPNAILLGTSLLINVATWIWLLVRIGPQEENIFLHYNILFGVDLIGTWTKVFYLPLIGLFILLVNAIIGWLLFRTDKFITQMFNAISLLCQIFILIASSLIIFLNV